MITIDQARAIALLLPEAEEGQHMDHPDFRVRKKIFMTLWPSDDRAVVFVDPDHVESFQASDSKRFSLNGWSKKYGALDVHLNHIGKKQFEDLVINSWERKAPKSLMTKHSKSEQKRT
jgi:hypothetical protein